MGRKGVFRKLGGEVPDLLNGGNWEATFATSVGGGGWVWEIKGMISVVKEYIRMNP